MIFYGVMKFDKIFASSPFVNFKTSPHDILRGVEIVLNCPGLSWLVLACPKLVLSLSWPVLDFKKPGFQKNRDFKKTGNSKNREFVEIPVFRKSGQARTSQEELSTSLGQARTSSGQARTSQDKLRTGQDRPGQARTGQDRPGQARTSQERPGQFRTISTPRKIS